MTRFETHDGEPQFFFKRIKKRGFEFMGKP